MATLFKVDCFYLLFIFRLTLARTDISFQDASIESNRQCHDFGKCSLCVDSVKCSCISGFQLSNNNSCRLDEGNATVLLSGFDGVRAFPLWKPEENYTISKSNLDSCGEGEHVSYNARGNYVYWTANPDFEYEWDADASSLVRTGTDGIGSPNIWRSRLDGSEKKIVVNKGLKHPEGVAYDWIGGNLYFADRDYIAVCSADFLFCSVLIQNNSRTPPAIALHPNEGLMFWSTGNAIMRAGMDGSNLIKMINNTGEVYGMAVDFVNSRIYWTDFKKQLIESTQFDGTDRRISLFKMNKPWGIDFIGDVVVWIDWLETITIEATKKFNALQRVTLFNSSEYGHTLYFFGLAIFRVANQPISRSNPCKNALCSHFCVIGPGNSFRCMCPVGMDLESENKTTCFLIKFHQCSSNSRTSGSCDFSDEDLRGTSISRCPGNQILGRSDGTCVCQKPGQVLEKTHSTCVTTSAVHTVSVTVGVVVVPIFFILIVCEFLIIGK